MWYTDSYRRYLCDMHIDDWDERFLEQYSSEEYVRLLKVAKAQTVMLYYQSHIGLCYFPNKDGLLHKALQGREDIIRRTEELCHENGISVVGYYSLIFNNRMAERQPEWQMRYADGKTAGERGIRYLKCCPNQPEYGKFVRKQIGEILSYFHPEGMFYDMPFWPQPCYCKACKKRYYLETGKAMPLDPQGEQRDLLDQMRMRWMSEFVKMVADYTRKLCPELTVEFNFAYSALPSMEPAMSEEIGRAGDYVGGDLYDDPTTQSIICKYYENISPKMPFEYMTCRCMPNLQNHTVTKSFSRLVKAAHLTMAHHGANVFIDAIDPAGTWDERVYQRLGEVAEVTSVYEQYMDGSRLARAGVIFLQQCKEYYNAGKWNHYTGVFGACETLIRHHIPLAVAAEASFDTLGDYSVLILPEPAYLKESSREKLRKYVENGGTLYFSGAGDSKLLEELTGGIYLKDTEDHYTYLAPCGEGCRLMQNYSSRYPLPMSTKLPLVEHIDPNYVLATITLPYQPEKKGQFASIHSNPPGFPMTYPGIAVLPYGKGRVIWSAAPLESISVCDYREIFLGLLDGDLQKGGLELCTTAPEMVELILSQGSNGCIRLSVIDLRDMDQEEAVNSFEISMKCEAVKYVHLLPEGEAIPFRQTEGRVCFMTRVLNIYDMYEIRLEEG